MSIGPEIASKKFAILFRGRAALYLAAGARKFASQCAVVYRSVKCEPQETSTAGFWEIRCSRVLACHVGALRRRVGRVGAARRAAATGQQQILHEGSGLVIPSSLDIRHSSLLDDLDPVS